MLGACLEAWADGEAGIDRQAAIAVVAETIWLWRNSLKAGK